MPEFPFTIDTDPDSPEFGRLRPVLRPGVARAMALGRELHMWNTVRDARASIMRNPIFLQSSPAFISCFLVGLAQIDQERRNLRALLADALDQVAV